MELKDFIKTALVDIVSAVKDAQTEVREYATIAPLATYGDNSTVLMEGGHAYVSNIDFDVAVSTGTEASTGKGFRAGVTVVSLNVSASTIGDATSTYQSISRLRFSIPVLLPCSASLDEIIDKDGKDFTRRELLNNESR